MTKSELIDSIYSKVAHLSYTDIESSINIITNTMAETLKAGKRIEVRGFGSFTLRRREPRVGRNPKTGESVSLPVRYAAHFKPGKEMRDRVNNT